MTEPNQTPPKGPEKEGRREKRVDGKPVGKAGIMKEEKDGVLKRSGNESGNALIQAFIFLRDAGWRRRRWLRPVGRKAFRYRPGVGQLSPAAEGRPRLDACGKEGQQVRVGRRPGCDMKRVAS